MTLLKSRCATVSEVIPGAPKRCPNCRRRTTRWHGLLSGPGPTPAEGFWHIGWVCDYCGTEYLLPQTQVDDGRIDVSALATYNSERARGIVHTPEYQARMAEQQQLFDAARVRASQR